MSITKGQTVFTQDGREYEFDHEAAGFAFVHPIVIVQTTSYHGDDFEEHEVVADHLVRFPIGTVSEKPWVAKINAETKAALDEKTRSLADINMRIGVASTDLRVKEKSLVDFEAGLDGEMKEILSRHKMLRDFKAFVGVSEVYFLANSHNGNGVPHGGTGLDGELRLKPNGEIYEYWPQNYEERHGEFFSSKREYERAVLVRFSKREKTTVEADANWKKEFPFLNVSAEVEKHIRDQEKLKKQKRIDDAAKVLANAQARFDELSFDD